MCYNFSTMNRPSDDPQSLLSPASAIEEYLGGDFHPLLDNLTDLASSRRVAVYLVGGPVRDWLLGRPLRDLDFVVEGDAPELAQALASRLGGKAVIHRRFGTASISAGNFRVDLVTARKESYPVPGALPVVEPSSILDDLARRDFSINAMALPLLGPDRQLVDPLGGRHDLSRGIVRILHSESFQDDPTRLLRAVRYEQRLGYTMDDGTARLLEEAVRRRFVEKVSGDRLRHELQRMFEEEFPARPLSRTMELGILPCLPGSARRRELLFSWEEEVAADEVCRNAGYLGWVAALGYPMSAGEGEYAARSLNMPAAWARVLHDATSIREAEALLDSADLPASDICRRLDGRSGEALLVSAALTEKPAVAANLRRYTNELKDMKPVLSGDDLLRLGVPPGHLIGDTLERLRQAKLDGWLSSGEEERRWVKGLVAALAPAAIDGTVSEGTGAAR